MHLHHDVTYVLLMLQEQALDVTSSVVVVSPSTETKDQPFTEHTIAFETWSGYNSTWKHFKVTSS